MLATDEAYDSETAPVKVGFSHGNSPSCSEGAQVQHSRASMLSQDHSKINSDATYSKCLIAFLYQSVYHVNASCASQMLMSCPNRSKSGCISFISYVYCSMDEPDSQHNQAQPEHVSITSALDAGIPIPAENPRILAIKHCL
jgi:hypothetical protein